MNGSNKYSLSPAERLRSRKDFEAIYSAGKAVLSTDRKLKALFLTETRTPGGVLMAAAVSKKAGAAVWRNRIKRLLKDSYRLNKEILLKRCIEKDVFVKLVFSPNFLNQMNSANIKRPDIEHSLIDLLSKIKKMI